MKIHQLPGFFIDIEGLDGSGVSTQVRLVAKSLRREGIKPFVTKEPTTGPVGKLIRQVLQRKISLPADSLQLLFAADRGEHLQREIIPKLEKGRMVITDRYAWSTVAFGSVDLSKEWLLDLNRDFILPDLTIFIEVSPEICLERIVRDEKRQGVELFEEEEHLEETWDTYHWLGQKFWWAQIAVVDGEREKEEITEEILSIIKKHPKFRKIK
ncbi:MAG: dTMP kinase [Patescibacteria group bacterium]